MAKKNEIKNVGLGVEAPKEKCEDGHCPFHGSLKLRGRAFTGEVVSDKMTRTVRIVIERRKYVPKYERYIKARTKIVAHNPDCVSAVIGDVVTVKECRPISKTKCFCVIQKDNTEK
ncbi:30S ribosomal protein S17 [Candidatus Woesearchaeota archaeon]|jgi:small subunit ribosomal protein S17|nr:30S ribosomal protein S17 [Candidatus Woesearchaeota archaeon]MBT3537439.1 30S ribosomal protein S17 [Candidatus Woesearchaeota archaeon]MBT4697760.1 30S ribosomal protein S17 [Candidatus Woesearchaeota archaeon]MBT4717553.1 30S ribosomal protein S17 [Candidatus Woesearchaeota archaeon]MBT7106251.1 30S ribosomal protein S17 [Candidatus Woesearchaeota archaeon]